MAIEAHSVKQARMTRIGPIVPIVLASACTSEPHRWFTVEPYPIQINTIAPTYDTAGARDESTPFIFFGASPEAFVLAGRSTAAQDRVTVEVSTREYDAIVLPGEETEGRLHLMASCRDDVCAEPGEYRFVAELDVYVCTEGAEVARTTGSCNHAEAPNDTESIEVVVVLE